jgi:hypothetical protein
VNIFQFKDHKYQSTNKKFKNPFAASKIDVVEYLIHLVNINSSYSVINTHKSMLMQTLPFFGASWCNNPTATRAISLYVNIFKFKDSKGIKVLINFKILETSQVRLGSMLMQTLPFFGASWCNNPTLIHRFMKGFFNIKPLTYKPNLKFLPAQVILFGGSFSPR